MESGPDLTFVLLVEVDIVIYVGVGFQPKWMVKISWKSL